MSVKQVLSDSIAQTEHYQLQTISDLLDLTL